MRSYFLTLSVLMIIVLFGCSNENDSNNTTTSDNASNEDSPFSFSMMAVLHSAEVPDDKILNALEENTNTDIDIQWVPGNTYGERLNASFATNSFPEAVYIGNQSTFVLFKEAIKDGQFWEIGPYLDQFEHLGKLDDQILQNSMVDGKLYSLYQGRPLSRQGMIYRKDWAKNLGLDAPTTTAEFYEMLRAFTEADPDGNGLDDTIGLTDRNDLEYGAFKTISSWFNTPNNWGEQDGQLLPSFMFPEYMETMNYLKDIHSNGFMNQDFPVTSKADQQAQFKDGTAGVYVGSMGDVQSLYNDAVELNPGIEFGIQNKVKGPDGTYQIWAIPGFGNLVMFPKSAIETEEELLQVLSFYDKLMMPENANLLKFGIDGEHYQVTEGRAEIIVDKAVMDREVDPYGSIEIGEPATNGRYELYHTSDIQQLSEELIKENEEYLIHDPVVALDSDTYAQKGEQLNQMIRDATWQYIIGQLDEEGFQDTIDAWKNEGGDAVIKEFNESFTASDS
ncbi:extracellular solute-binding protein [Aureibacillus halotolerans]|uniref:Carbohydrate ABC transporter substrate-binding protein (CUT1 family) n=1 Tax=Aureibacillus halotolerans TaxID=1508390 RepID=A0A4R6TVW0_9BACI|nr:extracellular solute-binding protein [Aureibacillus halotolerans]TDQ36373.1 carbohydrate ABC transporter substrate-binding protein (CUT1 family) [Aureibacillus halotolerans]